MASMEFHLQPVCEYLLLAAVVVEGMLVVETLEVEVEVLVVC
jgi:hypothetical protein